MDQPNTNLRSDHTNEARLPVYHHPPIFYLWSQLKPSRRSGFLSVVASTFDILLIVFNYAALRYKLGTCPVLDDGTQGPCPDTWGACLSTVLYCVWIQTALAFVSPKMLNNVFTRLITGSLLTPIGVYLVGNGPQNWSESSNCHGGEVFYALFPDITASQSLVGEHPNLIGVVALSSG